MFSIEEALQKCDSKELLNGTLAYADNIPYSSEEIADNDEKSSFMRRLEGSASQEDVRRYNMDSSGLLMKYIFSVTETEALSIDDNDIDDLMELRLTIVAESSYIERLDKLMFRIYFEKERPELEGLIYEIYDKYDWTKELLEKYRGINKEKTLIFQEETEDFKKKFGIKQIEKKDGTPQDDRITQNHDSENWISKKFGG